MRRDFQNRRKLRFESLESRALLAVFNFQDGVYPDASYAGTRDTQLKQDAPNTKYGSATSLNVDGDEPGGTGKDVAAIVKWDVSSLVPGTPVASATITLNITNHSAGQTYSIYEVKREWVEDEAAWNNWASGIPWQTAGAQGANDRGSTVLGTASPTATGTYTINFNGASALISQWFRSPDTNYGVIIAGSTSTNGFDFDSSEHATVVKRPKLTIDTGNPGPPGPNLPPTAMAGNDSTIWLPRVLYLDGTVTDDGQSTLTTTWRGAIAPVARGTGQFRDFRQFEDGNLAGNEAFVRQSDRFSRQFPVLAPVRIALPA